MKILITILLLISPTLVVAETCRWEIDSINDDLIVKANYYVNDYLVKTGTTRYSETQGSPLFVTRMITGDLNQECSRLINVPYKNKYRVPDGKKLVTRQSIIKKLKRLEGAKHEISS